MLYASGCIIPGVNLSSTKRIVVGPITETEDFGKQLNLLSAREIEKKNLGHSTCKLYTIPTTKSRLAPFV
jgi:hypothetical protein